MLEKRSAQRVTGVPPLFGVRGPSNSGKTRLIEALVPALRTRGLRIGTIKHAHHGATLDIAGKDSHRHASAGADCVLLLTPDQAGFFLPRHHEPDPLAWLELFAGRVDLVLMEGFSQMPIPFVVIQPGANGSSELVELPGGFKPGWILHCPWLEPNSPPLPVEVIRRLADGIVCLFAGVCRDRAAEPAAGGEPETFPVDLGMTIATRGSAFSRHRTRGSSDSIVQAEK